MYHGSVLNLRPGFGRRHPWWSFVILTVIVVGLFFGIRKLSTRAEVGDFFPLTCLGSWQNPANAQGTPESIGASSTDITAANGSVYDPTVPASQIFCGAFIPADYEVQGEIKNVGLTLAWKIPGLATSSDEAVPPDTATTSSSTDASTTSSTTAPTGASEDTIIKQFAMFFNVAFAETTDTVSTVPTSSDAAPPEPPPAPVLEPEPVPSPLPPQPSPESSTTANSETSAPTPAATSSDEVILMPPITAILEPVTSTATGTASTTAPVFALPPAPDNNFLQVSYSLDGQTWIKLAKVNPGNWQNLTATLPVQKWDDLKKLQIKIEGILTALRQIPAVYLDGMFVEVHYEVPPALPMSFGGGEAPAAAPDAAATSTVIVLPPTQQPVPVNQSDDFRANESPTFDFNLDTLPEPTTSPPEAPAPSSTSFSTPSSPLSFFFRAAGKIVAHAIGLDRPFTAHAQSQLPDSNNPVAAQIFGPDGAVTALQPTILVTGGNLRVILPNPGRAFMPGRYRMKLLIWKDGVVYETQNDFSWGVLAVNFNKSIYKIGDTAKIGLGFLNPQGHTICDGDITVDVSSPSGRFYHFSTTNKTIARSALCAPQSFTNDPDYSAALVAQEDGLYRVAVTAQDPSTGNAVTTSDNFSAQADPQFDVERIEATRIFPPATYLATLKILPNADYSGTVVETVPSSFDVTTAIPANKATSGDDQTITWQVDLKKGIETELKYSFKAPDVSPELYKLGPLTIGSWQESRQWQIAADAVAIAFRGVSKIGSATNGGNVTLTLSTGTGAPVPGDVVILYGGRGNTSDANAWGPVTAGYATTSAIDSTGPKFGVWYKVMGSTPDTTVQGAGGGSTSHGVAYGAYVIDGSTIDSAIFDASSTSTGQVTQIPNGPAIVTKTSGALVVTHAANAVNGGDASRGTVAGYTLIPGVAVSETDDITIEAAYIIDAAAGTEDPPAWSTWSSAVGGAITLAFKPKTAITLNNGTQPAAVTIGPDAAATTSDVFSFVTNIGTSSISNVTIGISTTTNVSQVQVTDSTGATVYGSSTNPGSTTLNVTTTNMDVSSTLTTFHIAVLPLSHGAMPAPPGATSTVTSTITAWTDAKSLSQDGTNTTSSIVTIDNKSPADVTNASGTAGSNQVVLSWTNPTDADFSTTVVLRATSSVTQKPTEGSTYSVNDPIGTSTVACVVASSSAGCTDTNALFGATYHYRLFAADSFANYSVGTTTSNGPFTPSANAAPVVSNVVLNHNAPIVLSPNATKTIDINYTVTDTNGCSDVFTNGFWASVVYRTGVAASCTVGSFFPDNLNCYAAATTTNNCAGGNSANVTDTVALYYFAQSTGDPSSSFPSDHWRASAAANDAAFALDTSSSPPTNVDVNVLTAINVTTSTINYGTLNPSSTTPTNQSTTVQNAGNSSTTLKLSGTDLAQAGGGGNVLSSIQTLSGTTGTAQTSTVNFSGGTALNKMFHFCSFSYDTADTQHNTTYRATELTATGTLSIYGGTATNNSLSYKCTIVSFTADSDLVVNRYLTPTTSTAPAANVQTITAVSTTSQAFVVPHGERESTDTSIGSEETWEYRLVNATTVQILVSAGNNSGGEGVRYEVVDWNNSDIRVQHLNGNAMTNVQTTSTAAIPTPVNSGKAWLIVTGTLGSGAATSEQTGRMNVRADFADTSTVQITKGVTGLGFNWSAQVIEDVSAGGIWNVQAGDIAMGTASTSGTFTLSPSVNASNTFAIGTSWTNISFSGQSPDTTVDNQDTASAAVTLTNGSTITATRGVTDANTFNTGVQAVEFLLGSGGSIPVNFEHYATSSFTYGGSEQQLSGTQTTVSGFLLVPPTSTAPVSTPVFWGLGVPAGNAGGTYQGTVVFTASFSP